MRILPFLYHESKQRCELFKVCNLTKWKKQTLKENEKEKEENKNNNNEEENNEENQEEEEEEEEDDYEENEAMQQKRIPNFQILKHETFMFFHASESLPC